MQDAARGGIVIGGARGAGLAIARALAGAGARLCLTDPEPEAAAAAARTLNALGIGADPADDLSVGRLAYAAPDALGEIDALVLCLNGGAGPDRFGPGRIAPLAHVLRHFAPPMQARGTGAFLIVTSQPAGPPDPWSQAAAAWLAAFVRAEAVALAAQGVRLNAIRAATADTATLPRFMAAKAPLRVPVPLGRVPAAADVAAAALHLLSDAAGAVTGVTMDLDGGLASAGGPGR